jgi:pentatricopeptide repeat protein
VAAELAAMAPGIVQFDSFSWNRTLVRDAKTGEFEKTTELFKRMQLKGMRLDRFRIVIVLNACASLHALKGGEASSGADHANWLQG